MGEVYLAEDTQLGRQVALKLLPANLTDNKERLSRFKQEARVTSTLNHPNILTIHEISQGGSLHFIATEFIDGVTLRQQMKNTRMKIAEVLDMMVQVAGTGRMPKEDLSELTKSSPTIGIITNYTHIF